jgi:hypothetical protein
LIFLHVLKVKKKGGKFGNYVTVIDYSVLAICETVVLFGRLVAGQQMVAQGQSQTKIKGL